MSAVCSTLLELTPSGLVTGLYLRGGIGFGEWIPGQSDVDFVATLDHRPSVAEVSALDAAHVAVAAEYPELHFDGPHVLVSDLAADPEGCPEVPWVLARLFEVKVPGDAMVAWHELAWHGVTVSGPPIESLGVWTSHARLLEHTRDNLDTYWRGTAEALAAMPSEAAHESACCWCVLGVARLHHLLVTGDMTTKSAAGRWGLGYYPEQFHRVLREALRIREGGPEQYVDEPAARGLDTAEFTSYVVRQGCT
ncbi:MAG: hypothetical protein JWM79_199 [Nocardioides sp.]|nr:hypothetical protein [Nocardioides sp.]